MVFAQNSFPMENLVFPRALSGPLLFLLFMNDIHLSLNKAIIKLFADDTNFFTAGDNFDLLRVTVASELQS